MIRAEGRRAGGRQDRAIPLTGHRGHLTGEVPDGSMGRSGFNGHVSEVGVEAVTFPVLAKLETSATLYGVFSRGLLTGSKPATTGDSRQHLPRLAGEQGVANAGVVERLHCFARERGMTPAQLALGWVIQWQVRAIPLCTGRSSTVSASV